MHQENHGSAIQRIVYNDVDPACANLFATVGGNQVNGVFCLKSIALT